jgi:hypothetical protein
MDSHPQRPRRSLAVVTSVALAVAGAMAVVAGPAAAQTTTTTPGANLQFASGSVTSLHGDAVQVSNANLNSESTVVLSDSTTYTKRQTAGTSALVVGACVRVNGTGSDAKGITASTVSVSAADANGCTGGFGGPGGRNGQRPNGQRRNFPNGQRPNFGNRSGNGTRPANFAVASGPIVSVSGDKVTVKSTTFPRPTSSSSKSKKSSKRTAAPKATTTKVVVTLRSSTTITQTVSGSAADVTVGKCVNATGTAGSGAVDATRVSISDPVNGACTFGGFGGGGFGPGGSGSGGPASSV